MESNRYGLGFHLHATGDGVWLEVYDAGVSFASRHQPSFWLTRTVISGTVRGCLAIGLLDERLGTQDTPICGRA